MMIMSGSSMTRDATQEDHSRITTQDVPSTEGSGRPVSRRLAAVDLDDVPEVLAFLKRLGLGSFRPQDVVAHLGRNDNWAGTTTTGAAVFVKRLGGEPDEARRRFDRVVGFERLAGQRGAGVRRPHCLGWDEGAFLVAFELLEDADTGSELAGDDRFDEGLAHDAGKVIASLHAMDPEATADIDRRPHPLPPLGQIRALSLAAFNAASAAELEAWSLLQHDRDLARALGALRTREREAPQVPIHADLRLDQFLVAGADELYLSDWEEFRRGDAARDVGGFAGEWLHRAILGIASSNDASVPDLDPSHEAVVERGVKELERLRPHVVAFWAGYLEGSDRVDPGLAGRAAAFAGWHLLDRMLASAAQRPRLLAVERAAAGIGRTALLDPSRFVGVLGLGETA